MLLDLLGPELGADVHALVEGLQLLPPDTQPETLAKWGLTGVDAAAALNMTLAFDDEYLPPFYERVGQAVQEEDPGAVIWVEPGSTLRQYTGPGPQWDHPLTRPQGIRQLVFAPHWYPDVYPTIGFNTPPRDFNADEWLYRDFTEPLGRLLDHAPSWLGNVPVVVGEFGTYFNLGGIEASMASDYEVSAHVLNSYYDAFEELSVGRMVWCFSADNDADYGELWNHEDFSLYGPDGEPRGWAAWERPHVRATSGRLLGEDFTSQFSFSDPEQGVPRPERRYELRMGVRETLAPTEVYVPRRQYPDGLYAWLSDGVAYLDPGRQTLYWYPDSDRPGHVHELRLEPPLPDREALDWSYLFRDGQVLTGRGGIR